MKARVQRFARRWWAGDAGPAGLLLTVVLTPVSWLWALVGGLRNRRFDRVGGRVVDGIQVVSVGNLAVGGTGKTPVASWVVRALSRRGARPAVVLRGYGRDEALLHATWTPTTPVVVDPDRIRAVTRAREAGADVAVLDDGFQHRRLARALDLVLLAVEDRFPGRVLPTGPYREPAQALERATALLLTRRSAPVDASKTLEATLRQSLPSADLVIASVHLVSGRLRSLTGEAATDRFESPYVLTAIARPDAFLAEVARRSRGEAVLGAYEDHHEFTEDDARDARARAGRRPIVMTEKDAVKLEPHSSLLGDAWVVEEEVEWDWGEEQVLELLARTHKAGAA